MKINLKKLTVLAMAALMAGAAFGGPTADAAKGGAKLSVPKVSAPAPKPAPAPSAPKTNDSAVKDSPNTKEYAPSKKASEHSETAPAAKSGTNTAGTAANAASANSGSRWGSALRTMGLFAGGMMLGSLLSSMFGLGGLFGDILGLIANVAIFMVAFMAIKWVWNKFRGNSNSSAYSRQNYEREQQNINVTPNYSSPIQDIKPPTNRASGIQDIKPPTQAMGSTNTSGDLIGVTGYDYEADRAADRYRKL